MKNNFVRIALLLILLAAMLLSFACGPGANTNQENGQNQGANQPVKVLFDPGRCQLSGTTAATLKKDIEDALKDKKNLKKNLEGADGNGPWLDFDVIKSPNGYYYEAIFYGAIGGNDQFEELTNILNDFNGTKECLRRAVFRGPRKAAQVNADRLEEFEWIACDYPKRPCADGSCNCDKSNSNTSGMTNGGTSNSNRPSNTNSNTSSNSN